jgi:Sulfotransferase family
MSDHSQPAPAEEARGAARRFQAFGVGIPKTGTTSIGGLFANYRSAHEYRFQETAAAIAGYKTGQIDREQFRSFLLHRDREGALEMDSASLSFAYVDILVEAFPDARFIFTIRDCYSWLDSLINMCLSFGGTWPEGSERMWEYGYAILGVRLPRAVIASPEALLSRSEEVIDAFLRLWANGNRAVLESLDPKRFLVLRTPEIAASIGRIAAFIGIPAGSLVAQNSHMFPSRVKFDILRRVDSSVLTAKVEEHGSELMKELFPGLTLRDVLERRVPA